MNSAGELLPLVEIVAQFEDVGLSAADAMTIFGLRAGPGMLALVEQGSGALSELTTQMEESGGTAQTIADTQLDTFNGQMTLLKSATEGLLITIGEGLVPTLRELADNVTSLVQSITEWANEHPRLFQLITAVVGVVGVLAFSIGALLLAIGLLTPGVVALTSALARLTVAARTSTIATSGMLGPVGLAVTALALLAATLWQARDAADDTGDVLSDELVAKLSEAEQQMYRLKKAGAELSEEMGDRLAEAIKRVGEEAGTSTEQVKAFEDSLKSLTAAQLENRIETTKATIARLEDTQSQAYYQTAAEDRIRILASEKAALADLEDQFLTATAREEYEASTRAYIQTLKDLKAAYNDDTTAAATLEQMTAKLDDQWVVITETG